MPEWPASCPPDLQYKLETVLGFRSFGPQDLYAVFKEWAEEHRVEAPADLRERPGRQTRHEL